MSSAGDGPPTLAVLDVGSNSGRVVVLRALAPERLEVLADARAPFRLAQDVQRKGRFSRATMERTTAAMGDFATLARRVGATRLVAVATEAVRRAENGRELLDLIREHTGLKVRVITGSEEATLSFLGATHGLAAGDGVVVDIGGGSVELVRFADRSPVEARTLPLGALRLSAEFLAGDPPSRAEMRALRDVVAEGLEAAGLEALRDGERMIGTGGTIRNLAKIDRRRRAYRLTRLHGYVLDRGRIDELLDLLASAPLGRRRSIPGLNPDRADSIVAGTAVLMAVMDLVGAGEVTVSGQGLREGLALDALGAARPPAPRRVREASVLALARRFATWDGPRAEVRALVCDRLWRLLAPGANPEAAELLRVSALLLDAGRSVDYYRRYDHAASIAAEADLEGYSHREIALLAATIRTAGDRRADWRAYRPLLDAVDGALATRLGFTLALGESIEERIDPEQVDRVRGSAQGRHVTLEAPIADPWLREALARRFERAFGGRLEIRADAFAGSADLPTPGTP